ncbi:MAG: DUF1573 domain-containing protein [Bacteroidia bacterium]
MNKCTLIVLFGLFLATIALGQNDSIKITNQPGALIEFKESSIDLGAITFDSLRKAPLVFEFTNIGNEPLIISHLPSSGFFDWVMPYYTHEPIMPGQKSTIVLKHWLPRYGPFNKSFTVISNAKNGDVICKVKGNILRVFNPKLSED